MVSLDRETELSWTSIGTFGVFWYQNYDERTYCTLAMCKKIQRNKQTCDDYIHRVSTRHRFCAANLLPQRSIQGMFGVFSERISPEATMGGGGGEGEFCPPFF